MIMCMHDLQPHVSFSLGVEVFWFFRAGCMGRAFLGIHNGRISGSREALYIPPLNERQFFILILKDMTCTHSH